MGGQLCVHTDGHSDPHVPGCWLWSGAVREPGPGFGSGEFQHCTDQVMIDEMQQSLQPLPQYEGTENTPLAQTSCDF